MLGRRDFLKCISGLVFLPLRRPFFKSGKRTFLFEEYIAGLRFYYGKVVAKNLKPGDRLRLQRESDNPYDEMAIEVFTESHMKLGYVPRYINTIPASLLDQGIRLRAEVTTINPPPAPPWERVQFTVYQIGG